MAVAAPAKWSQSDYGPLLNTAATLTASDSLTYATGRSILINCTASGNVALVLFDGSTVTIPVYVGLTILPWAVQAVLSTGTTATATYANLA